MGKYWSQSHVQEESAHMPCRSRVTVRAYSSGSPSGADSCNCQTASLGLPVESGANTLSRRTGLGCARGVALSRAASLCAGGLAGDGGSDPRARVATMVADTATAATVSRAIVQAA